MGSRLPFQCVPKGTGKTFTIDQNSKDYIGTMHCDDSVGILFPIDAKRFYCANIQCLRKDGKSLEIVPHGKGDVLTNEVFNGLKSCMEVEKWNVDEDAFAANVHIVCQKNYVKEKKWNF